LVDRRSGEVELFDVLGQRQLGDGQLVAHGSGLLLGDLGLQQITDDAGRFMLAFYACGHDLVIGATHPVELECRVAFRCLIPGFDGAIFSHEWKEALWARFYMGAPRRQRRSVEQYKIAKRA